MFLALRDHMGPVFGSLRLTPFKGDHENESRTGSGGKGRQTQFCSWSVDDFGLEYLVSNSNKDSLGVQMRQCPLVRELLRPPKAALP